MKRNTLYQVLAGGLLAFFLSGHVMAEGLDRPIAPPDLVFEEVDGLATVEAEHFYQQDFTGKRAWYITSPGQIPDLKPDTDSAHLAGASGGVYIEILPDTRSDHGQKLIKSENFTDKPGEMAVLRYKVNITTPGRYYVWVRSQSTGTEDNGVHVGLGGQWPESGQRWQTTQKNKWAWDCRQRTEKVHTGVPMRLFLDIKEPGAHEILLRMREDGSEVDRFILSNCRVGLNGSVIGEFNCPLGAAGFVKGPTYDSTWKNIPGNGGDVVRIQSMITSADGKEYSRARWSSLDFEPAGQATRKADAKLETVAPASKSSGLALVMPRGPDGDGSITISGELKQWHDVVLTLDGPFAHELDNAPNPFTDYDLRVTFTHASGKPSFVVPGYFAADGDAANSSADSGTKWRVRFTPDQTGDWSYSVSFLTARMIINGETENVARVMPLNEKTGSFTIAPTDKTGRDFRARGRLEYVGKHYLQFAGTKEYFIKAGADAPETFLAYVDFDNIIGSKPKVPLKTWGPHLRDWKSGDPTWKDGKGKAIIGAINYLSEKGANAFSFLTYNAGGDGDNIWPFVQRDDKLHYDCSKLDQWTVVLDHAQKLGLYLHFKTQETENDDSNGPGAARALDGGSLGAERRLYYRELIARFGHELALNWNFGEENTQSPAQQRAEISYVAGLDPYHHLRVIHTYPNQQDKVYSKLIGSQSELTGASLQNEWNHAHQRTFKWVSESAKAGKPWVVANDEQGSAAEGVPPDPGYEGFSGKVGRGKSAYDLNDVRKYTLWGTLMAGGQGVEYYFGYKLPQNDLTCEDYRSRDKSWEFASIAIKFFHDRKIPFQEMSCHDELVGNDQHDNSKYCFAKKGELYLVYLPNGGKTDITLPNGRFSVSWFNPRTGDIGAGSPIEGHSLDAPDQEDWLAVIRRVRP